MVNEDGFSLIEVLIALVIWAIVIAIALPDFIGLLDGAQLQQTALQIVSDLRSQQMKAEQVQLYQEVRFAPFNTYYFLYGNGTGYEAFKSFDWPTTYYDGYLHLQSPTVRYDDYGNVSESGQIGLVDPFGHIQNIVLYLQYGDMRLTSHMLMGT
ncbi:MAG: prepilin-type N-terminal cleavage/methylation domain-containing protein [Acidibacillus sp.]|nr:prepilin-type N-terminal cleavage/methylation domain-containing protein [Acidibacillus sp.]